MVIKERKIVEIPDYTASLTKLANPKLADLAIASIDYYLRYLAHEIPIIKGRKRLRAMDTKPVVMADGTFIPAHTVWFQIWVNAGVEEVQLMCLTVRANDE